MSSFKHNSETITLKFNYRIAKLELPPLGLRLLNIIEGENINDLIQNVILNDEKLLNLLYCFVRNNQGVAFTKALDELEEVEAAIESSQEIPSRYETFIDNVTDLEPFREALWEAIENFTPAQMRPLLRTARTEIVKALEAAPETLKEQSSASLPEAASTPTPTPSEN